MSVFILVGICLGCAVILALWARETIRTEQIKFGARLGFIPPIEQSRNPFGFWALVGVFCTGSLICLAFAAQTLFEAIKNST